MTTAEKFRTQRGSLTQVQAAAAIGCDVASIRDWEQGRHEPAKWVRRLALAKLATVAGTKLLETQNGDSPMSAEDIAEYVANDIGFARAGKPAPEPESPSDG